MTGLCNKGMKVLEQFSATSNKTKNQTYLLCHHIFFLNFTSGCFVASSAFSQVANKVGKYFQVRLYALSSMLGRKYIYVLRACGVLSLFNLEEVRSFSPQRKF